MKSKLKRWEPNIKSPWLTRAEAADYLRWSTRTIDRTLVAMNKGKQPGKIRFELQDIGTGKKMIRLLAEDVYAICPLPEEGTLKLAV